MRERRPAHELPNRAVFDALVQSCGPVKNHRISFDKTLSWFQHQKLTSVVGDCILIDGGIWYESRIEQLSRNADLRGRPALHQSCHQSSVAIYEEKFSLPSPRQRGWAPPASETCLMWSNEGKEATKTSHLPVRFSP